jgi:hypothetical protein
MWQGTEEEVFDRISEYPLVCLLEVYMIILMWISENDHYYRGYLLILPRLRSSG